jgi:RHS repeat-associated protein
MMALFRYSQASRGVVFYYHNDHLNTPIKMTDEKGNIVWEVVSKHPFGSFEVSSKEVVLSDYTGNSNDSFNYKIENPLRFPGQYDDSDTKDLRSLILNNAEGLYYNYHRWYNPDIGRYMEVDPYKIIYFSRVKACYRDAYNQKIGHRYIYATNNSIIFIDNTGLKCYTVDKCLLCFYLNGDDILKEYAIKASKNWGCDPEGKGCKKKWDEKPTRCCGYAPLGSGSFKITDLEECDKDTCITVLHEIAHAFESIEDDEEAEKWAQDNRPWCCPYDY